MNLIIDIGNTTVKLGVFDDSGELVFKNAYSEFLLEEIFKTINDFKEIKNGIISTVKEVDHSLIASIESNLGNLILLDEKTPIPIINLYKSLETLGKDRIAAAAGANFYYPDKNVLIIDAGTALTIDFINRKKEFIGGIISPGLEMRFKALHHFTDKLPLLHPQDIDGITGKTTEEAIVLGIQNGIIYELDEYIQRYSSLYDDLITIITGGDAQFFTKRLKNHIVVNLNLVLTGLNRILDYNVK